MVAIWCDGGLCDGVEIDVEPNSPPNPLPPMLVTFPGGHRYIHAPGDVPPKDPRGSRYVPTGAVATSAEMETTD